jgi:pantoate kinase
MKLNGKKFYKLNNYSKREVGLIAEEVNEVYPEFVSEDASSINYGKMVTVLVEAVKELNDNLNQAKERIRILETDK